LIERVEFLRKLGIDRERQQAIPANAFGVFVAGDK
jgi:hypothetical protein